MSLNSSTGSHNVAVGFSSMISSSSLWANTAIGNYSGQQVSTGQHNIFIGYSAGRRAINRSNELYISSFFRSSAFEDSTMSLIYGNQDSLDIGAQRLKVNGRLHLPLGASSGYVLTSDANGLASWAASSGGGLTSSNFVYNETPSGTVNSSNVTFTLANTPVAGTVRVWVSGIKQKLTTHYSVSGSTITFVTAPTTGSDIDAEYIK
jgi:hypothetical protein